MHQVILDRLEEYLSGSLESREFTVHLESCPRCRTELSDLRELSGDLKTLISVLSVARGAWSSSEC